MHKETVLAVGIGLLFGLFVTVGMYRLFSNRDQGAASTEVAQSIIADISPTPEFTGEFRIVEPPDGFITSKQEIEISGTTKPGAYLILTNRDENQQLFQADDNGSFSLTLSLLEGPNFFSLTSIDTEGEDRTINRVVVFEAEIPIDEEGDE